MNTKGKMVAALAAGVAAGIIVGILFAPNKGRKTRKRIIDQGKKMTKGVQYKFRKGKDKFNDLKSDVEMTVKEKAEAFV